MSAAVDRLAEVIRELRSHCLWTAALTHESLVEYLIEESYELVEAIEEGGGEAALLAELGDVLLQIALHAEIARERGAFDLEAVADALRAKLVRRNRHVFMPDGTLRESFPETIAEVISSWDAAKREERAAAGEAGKVSASSALTSDPLEGLPRRLPALALADKALGRAERRLALAPGPVETAAFRPSPLWEPGDGPEDEGALGELLLRVVASARERGLDSERALRRAVGGLSG